MLKSKIFTPEEKEEYMVSLRTWLKEQREMPVEEMAGFFSARLKDYENVHLRNWGEEYAHIADHFYEETDTLLDIGCGTGLELEAVFRRFPDVKVTGIDLNTDMLQQLNKKYGDRHINLIHADYFEYPFGEECFDAALSVETLHHFKYDKKQEIYNKLFRCLRDGGCYVECDYVACCPEEEALCLDEYEYRRKKSGVPEDTFIHIDIPLTLEHQLELMKRAGFGEVEVLYQSGTTVIFKAQKYRRP